MRLIVMLNILAFTSTCTGECLTSEADLQLENEYGFLKSKNYPSFIRGGQYCRWTLPTEKQTGKALFIYFSQMDLIDNNHLVADIAIGNGQFFSLMPHTNCRLYGINVTDIDIILLENLKTKYIQQNRICDSWLIDDKEIETVTFRSHRESYLFSSRRKFYIIYEYVSIHKHRAEKSVESDQSTTYIIIVVLLVLLLLITTTVFIYKYRKATQMYLQRMTTHRVSVTQARETSNNKTTGNLRLTSDSGYVNSAFTNTYHDVTETDDHHSNTYASIGKNNNYHSDEVDANPDAFIHDIPTNNRDKAPTAHYSGSNVSDTTSYQIPIRRQETLQEEVEKPDDSNIKDVYAVVQKDEKQQNI